MNLDRYVYSAGDTFLDFEFESDGPNGKIRKIVRYSPQNAGGITYFNSGFGDLNQKTGQIDDLAITNNKDRGKIGISANWNAIEPLLDVFGYDQKKGWQPFRKNVNFHAFLVKCK